MESLYLLNSVFANEDILVAFCHNVYSSVSSSSSCPLFLYLLILSLLLLFCLLLFLFPSLLPLPPLLSPPFSPLFFNFLPHSFPPPLLFHRSRSHLKSMLVQDMWRPHSWVFSWMFLGVFGFYPLLMSLLWFVFSEGGFEKKPGHLYSKYRLLEMTFYVLKMNW